MNLQGAAVLLQTLRSLGTEVTRAGDRIRLEAEAGTLTDDIRDRVRTFKPELAYLLELEERQPTPGAHGEKGAGRAGSLGDTAIPADEHPKELADHPVLSMRLSAYETAGCPIEIAVPGLDSTIWFVPNDLLAATLVDGGVRRGRIWTAAELLVVAALPEACQPGVLTLATLKSLFDGNLVEVLGPKPEPHAHPSDTENPGPIPSCHACSGRHFWRSIHDVVVCALCHPPAAAHLVAAWIEDDVEREADHD